MICMSEKLLSYPTKHHGDLIGHTSQFEMSNPLPPPTGVEYHIESSLTPR